MFRKGLILYAVLLLIDFKNLAKSEDYDYDSYEYPDYEYPEYAGMYDLGKVIRIVAFNQE